MYPRATEPAITSQFGSLDLGDDRFDPDYWQRSIFPLLALHPANSLQAQSRVGVYAAHFRDVESRDDFRDTSFFLGRPTRTFNGFIDGFRIHDDDFSYPSTFHCFQDDGQFTFEQSV